MPLDSGEVPAPAWLSGATAKRASRSWILGTLWDSWNRGCNPLSPWRRPAADRLRPPGSRWSFNGDFQASPGQFVAGANLVARWRRVQRPRFPRTKACPSCAHPRNEVLGSVSLSFFSQALPAPAKSREYSVVCFVRSTKARRLVLRTDDSLTWQERANGQLSPSRTS